MWLDDMAEVAAGRLPETHPHHGIPSEHHVFHSLPLTKSKGRFSCSSPRSVDRASDFMEGLLKFGDSDLTTRIPRSDRSSSQTLSAVHPRVCMYVRS